MLDRVGSCNTQKGVLLMRMEKRKFRIGELANQLNVERFVIRFWEKEFDIKAHRSTGGQRFYDETDLKKFKAIKELLYKKKFTIAGAKQILSKVSIKKNVDLESILASQVTTLDAPEQREHITPSSSPEKIYEELMLMRKKLEKLRNLI